MFVESILKFAGSEQCVSQTVRLDRFSGNREEIEGCSHRNVEYGIRQLLTADSRTRRSYYLSDAEIAELNSREVYADSGTGIEFYSTDFRFDDYRDFRRLWKENEGESEVIVFTHEWLLNVPMRRNVLRYIQFLCKRFFVKRNISTFLHSLKTGECEYVTEF